MFSNCFGVSLPNDKLITRSKNRWPASVFEEAAQQHHTSWHSEAKYAWPFHCRTLTNFHPQKSQQQMDGLKQQLSKAQKSTHSQRDIITALYNLWRLRAYSLGCRHADFFSPRSCIRAIQLVAHAPNLARTGLTISPRNSPKMLATFTRNLKQTWHRDSKSVTCYFSFLLNHILHCICFKILLQNQNILFLTEVILVWLEQSKKWKNRIKSLRFFVS